MDWSPFNDKRCDSKLCQYGSVCNIIILFLTLILITGFAQAGSRCDQEAADIQPDRLVQPHAEGA